MDKQFKIRCRGVIIDQSELLVVEHVRKEGCLALPGGHLDWGEDVKSALSRELVEELGVIPVIGPLLYIHTFVQESGVQTVEFIFRVENSSDYRNIGAVRTHAHELAKISWVSPHEVETLRPIGVGRDFASGTLGTDSLRYLIDGI